MTIPPIGSQEIPPAQPSSPSFFSILLNVFCISKPSPPSGQPLSLKGRIVPEQFGVLNFVKRLFGFRSSQSREKCNERISGCAQNVIAASASAPLEGMEGGKAVCPKKREDLRKDMRGPDGTKLGTEVAQPRCSRDEIIQSLKAAKKDAEEKLQSTVGPEKQALERIINRCGRAIQASEEMRVQRDYSASGDVREQAKEKDPKNIFCCELTNCYEQVVKDENGKDIGSFLRFGALTDKVQGLIRYRVLKKIYELRELQSQLKDPPEGMSPLDQVKKIDEKRAEVEEAIREEKKRVETLKKTLEKSGRLSKRLRELFDEALKILGEKWKEIDCKSGVSPIEKAYEDRRFIIQQQAVQFLNIQVRSHGKEAKEGPLHLYQLSLLNPSKIDITESGIVHSETDEILDEAELFKELGTARVMLDAQEAPYVDAAGVYHLQKPEGMEADKITIVPHFINVVPQAHLNKKDLELYKEVNQQALQEMEKQLTQLDQSDKKQVMMEKLKKCKKSIEAGKVHFSIAEDMAEIGRFLGWNLSINCHSGKDRTGVISYSEVVNILLDKASLDEKARRTHKDYLISKMFDSDGIPRGIVRANGNLHLKVVPWKLTVGSLQGRMKSIWEGIMGGMETLKANLFT